MRYLANDISQKSLRQKLRQNSTDAEQLLWMHLRNRRLDGFKFRRQFSFHSYILDFYCPKVRLAVELDGSQHLENINDQDRTQVLNQYGITVMRFWNYQVFEEIDVVVRAVWEELKKLEGGLCSGS